MTKATDSQLQQQHQQQHLHTARAAYAAFAADFDFNSVLGNRDSLLQMPPPSPPQKWCRFRRIFRRNSALQRPLCTQAVA